ncbi:MAG: rRNA maturation RNase YbeY [Ignavibacterium sp.]|nr:rRNA maturation RNase YbeY [Ignavibacterium sp.]MDW8376380.1 rRNA maturation RNase YbeY [Ignavibacteriales bacterium]
MKNVQVYSLYDSINKRNIHKLIFQLTKELDLRIKSLEVNIVKDDLVLELNKKYLNHFYNTDIITFNYSSDTKDLEGEIYISFDEAKKNSKRFNVNFNEELKRLIIHGILHLIGFNDSTKSEKKKMTLFENKLLKLFTELPIIK